MPVRFRLATCLCGALLLAGAAGAQPAVKRVLVVYATGRLLPAVVAFDRGFRGSLGDTPSRPVEIYDEFLDAARFSGADYDEAVATHLRRKYAGLRPDVVVAAGREALEFVVRMQAQLPDGTPVVHAVTTEDDLEQLGALPPTFVGIPTRDEFTRTIEQALRLHPDARRLLVVLGNRSARDRRWVKRVQDERQAFEARVAIDILESLPPVDIASRLATLGPDTIVFSPGYEVDTLGNSASPYARIAAMAAATRAPVYSPLTTTIGAGVVGGYATDFEIQGRGAAQAVSRLLDGVSPAALDLPAVLPTVFHVDWQQVRRLGLAESALPADAVVHFRPPPLWATYRSQILAALGVMLLQAGLIVGLLIERRRRHHAEMTAASSRTELAHASRLAVAGELAAALAHEINQPLGAILSNADTAEMILESGADKHDLLRTILGDIRRDDLRASEVIRRLRGLLQKNQVERAPFSLDDAASDVELVLRGEARRRRVALTVQPAGSPGLLIGDRVQIQQVLINLVLNAMDAVADLPESSREVSVVIRHAGDRCTFTVTDGGSGIAPENLPKVFESFFTTKRKGMGLGLSIARTIVEAHGGTIRAENAPTGGAMFIVDLPMAPTGVPLAAVPA